MNDYLFSLSCGISVKEALFMPAVIIGMKFYYFK
jgi:hypothetical protein